MEKKNKKITIVEDTMVPRTEFEKLEKKLLEAQLENQRKDRVIYQYANMHCHMIADILSIKSKIYEANNGKNAVLRHVASLEAHRMFGEFLNNYGVEEFADIYHGLINGKDIHRFPYKHSKLDVVSSCYKSEGFSKVDTAEFGQWIVDRSWK